MAYEQPADTLFDELGGYVRIAAYDLWTPGQDGIIFGLNPLLNAPQSYASSCAELRRFVDALLSACNDRKSLDGYNRFREVQYPFEEITRNAIDHGNHADPQLQLSLKLIECNGAYVIRIRDSGTGYDVRGTLAAMRAGERYFKYFGEGTKATADADTKITYENNGTTWNIVMRK